MKKKTKTAVRSGLILGGLFFAALILYFILSYRSMEQNNTVYTSINEARLPLLYTVKAERKENPMVGHLQEMGSAEADEVLSVLSEDRTLNLQVEERGSSVASVQYEIRTLDLEELLEKGTIEHFTRSQGMISLQIPLQNLMEQDQQYLMKLTLNIGERNVYYYTRILWLSQDFSEEMLDLARSFTEKTFSKSDARSLSNYLETKDTADNSSLHHVTLESSFQQITFGNTGMTLTSDLFVKLKELDGVMGAVQIRYFSAASDEGGNVRRFRNEDNYVFRYDPQRIFIMSFDRQTEEIFDSKSFRFQNNRLILGVQEEESLETLYSGSEQFVAFHTAKGLYRYDSGKKQLLNLFSFQSETKTGDYFHTAHGLKILSVKNNGDVDFIVYGYMNRGQHEGYNGILCYTYDNSEDTVVENFFLPIAGNEEQIMRDVETLSYRNESGLFYFYYDGCIYGLDTNSFELMIISEGLSDWEIVSNENGQYVVYQDEGGEDSYHSEKLNFLNLETDQKTELREDNRYLRVLGFIGNDLIYGMQSRETEELTLRGEIPMTEIRIMDTEFHEKTNYQREDIYFGNAEVLESRVHFLEYRKDSKGYYEVGDDSIISNRENSRERKQGLESFTEETLQKSWYLSLPGLGQERLTVHTPGKYSIERSSDIDIGGHTKEEKTAFYAYSLGRCQGVVRTLEEAYLLIYDQFGYIKDEKGHMLWNRTDKETIVSIRNPEEKMKHLADMEAQIITRVPQEDYQFLNAYGMDLNSVLYYVGKGSPVKGYFSDRAYFIVGYNQYNVILRELDSEENTTMGREDATAAFVQNGNRFLAMVG